MKEIWKLIELLNEYEEKENLNMYEWEIEWEDILAYSKFRDGYETINVWESIIISKWYEFIKWLVENDKIDFEWMSWHANIIKYLRDVKKYGWEQIKEWVVLMLLAISDTPIEDLLLYLK